MLNLWTEAQQLARLVDLILIARDEADAAGVLGEIPPSLLSPPPGFATLHCDVYRSHVRELCARYVGGERLDLATDAELLVSLSEASLRAPLRRGPDGLFHQLFLRVMGPEAYESACEGAEPPVPQWPGELEEVAAEARRRLHTGRPQKAEKGARG